MDDPIVYQDHGIKFSIPSNWSVVKDEHLNGTQFDGSPINDTKIVLTDGDSAIRIDIIEIPQVKWLLNLYDDEPQGHFNLMQYRVFSILEPFYRKEVLLENQDSNIAWSGGSGLPVHPDNIDDVNYRTGKNGDLAEWIVVWTKSKYTDNFIGVHALYRGNYPVKILSMPDNRSQNMQTSLYGVLESFATVGGNMALIFEILRIIL